MKTIGIIGGMGPLATADLYKKITVNTAADKDQDQIHIVIDSNTAIPDRTKNIIADGEDPVPEMTKSIQRLVQCGADFLIMPCNTAHFFYDRLTAVSDVPILNMLNATVEHIKETFGPGKSVGLLATDGTIQSGIYDTYLKNAGLNVVKPVQNQAKVMEFIYDGIKKNNLDIGIDGLMAAAEEMEAMGAEIFILGCTELSAATDYYHFDERFVDPLLVLSKKSIVESGGQVR